MSGSVARPLQWSQLFAAAVDRFAVLLRRLAFVGAVALPAVYLPVLFAGEIGPITPAVALALLGLHVLAIIAGHRHNQPDSASG